MSRDQLIHCDYGFLLLYLALIYYEALSPILQHLLLLGIVKLGVRFGREHSVILYLIRIHFRNKF